MPTNTPTPTRTEPDAELEDRVETMEETVETMEETILQVAEQLAGHLHDCPGATDDERRDADALAARWAATLEQVERAGRTVSETTVLEERYTELLVEITNALGVDFQLMREMDDVVGMRLAAAQDHDLGECSPLIAACEHRLDALEQDFDRLRLALALMGHLADKAKGVDRCEV